MASNMSNCSTLFDQAITKELFLLVIQDRLKNELTDFDHETVEIHEISWG
jgi:hypothetical protein